MTKIVSVENGTGYLLQQGGKIRLVTVKHVIAKAQKDNRSVIRATFRGQGYDYQPSEFVCNQTPGLVDPLCSAPVPARIRDLPRIYENALQTDFYVGEKLFFPKEGAWHEYRVIPNNKNTRIGSSSFGQAGGRQWG